MADSTPPPDDRPPRFTRRQVVAASALLAASGTLGVGARIATWWDQPPGEGYAALSNSEAELVDALAEALFPAGGVPALSGADAGIARFMDEVLSTMEDPMGNLLRTLLHALDDWALLTRGRGYARLSLEDRSERLAEWLRNPRLEVRGAVTSLMIFISMGYCGHPEVKTACGWIFPCGYER